MTAVEWLDEQLQDKMYFVYGYTDGVRKVTIPLEDYMRLKQEALEMEKQQIIDAYRIGECEVGLMIVNKPEQYYNETYGSKGSGNTPKCTCNVDPFLCQIHGTSDGKTITAF